MRKAVLRRSECCGRACVLEMALGKVVFTTREHVITLEARDNGLVGTTLRYPYEVRQAKDYFDVIEDEKVPKDMLDLAVHIVDQQDRPIRTREIRRRIRGRAQGAPARYTALTPNRFKNFWKD
jgi:non-homologous end joining protein Ku